jgi:hypothetical protein
VTRAAVLPPSGNLIHVLGDIHEGRITSLRKTKIVADLTLASFLSGGAATASDALPAGFLPSPNGSALAKLLWSCLASFPIPVSVAEASCGVSGRPIGFIGLVT